MSDTATTTVYDYAALLASLRQVAPEAHIAGGAVRDTILGKSIQDIDVFLADRSLETAAKRLRSHHAYVKVGEWREYLGFSDPAMTRLCKFEKADKAIPVCLIGLKSDYVDPAENMSRFDFGICMAAFDGTNITRAAEFNDDANAKTFTLHRADTIEQFAYSMSRYKKITAGRYNGWDLEVPGAFGDLATQWAANRYWFYDKFDERGSVLRPKERMA